MRETKEVHHLYEQGAYAASLTAAVKALGGRTPSGSRDGHTEPLCETLRLAAHAALCVGQPARALKFASQLCVLQPQDTVTRDLVRECTLEMEYQARVAIMNQDEEVGLNQTLVMAYLTQLEQSVSHQATANILDRLSEMLSGVGAQIAFSLADGYERILGFLSTHPKQVERLLLVAGVCQLSRKHAGPTPLLTRVRWPPCVLQCLTHALLHHSTSDSRPDLVTSCTALLAVAAQDRLQRHTLLAAPQAAPVHGTTPAAPVTQLTGSSQAALAPPSAVLTSAGWNSTDGDSVTEAETWLLVSAGGQTPGSDCTVVVQQPARVVRSVLVRFTTTDKDVSDNSSSSSPVAGDIAPSSSCTASSCAVDLLSDSAEEVADVSTTARGTASGGWPDGCMFDSLVSTSSSLNTAISQAAVCGGGLWQAGPVGCIPACELYAPAPAPTQPQLPAPTSVLTYLVSLLNSMFPLAGSTVVSAPAAWPLAALEHTAHLIGGFCSDKQSLLLLARTGKPLTALVGLYQALDMRAHDDAHALQEMQTAASPAQQQAGQQPADTVMNGCCAALRQVLYCFTQLCRVVPAAVRAEAFQALSDSTADRPRSPAPLQQLTPCSSHSQLGSASGRRLVRSDSVCSNLSQQAGTVPTTLLAALVHNLARVVRLSPLCLQPEIGRDGQPQSLACGKRAADPCQPAHHTDQSVEGAGEPTAPASLLQLWLQAVSMVGRSGSRRICRELFRSGLTDVLQDIVTQFRTEPQLVSSAEQVWCRLALSSSQCMQEALDEGRVHVLVAVARQGLSSALHTMSAQVQHSAHAPDVMSSSQMSSASTGCMSSPVSSATTTVCAMEKAASSINAQQAALRALDKLAQLLDTCSGGDFMQLIRPDGLMTVIHTLVKRQAAAASPGAGQNLELLPQLYDASRCVLLGCLERARRTADLASHKAPTLGWFGTLKSRQLLQLEMGLRSAWAEALLPHQSPRLPSPSPTPSRTSGSEWGRDVQEALTGTVCA